MINVSGCLLKSKSFEPRPQLELREWAVYTLLKRKNKLHTMCPQFLLMCLPMAKEIKALGRVLLPWGVLFHRSSHPCKNEHGIVTSWWHFRVQNEHIDGALLQEKLNLPFREHVMVIGFYLSKGCPLPRNIFFQYTVSSIVHVGISCQTK